MASFEVFAPDERRKLAYHRTMAEGAGADKPGIVFLGGFRSDMGGTKAVALEAWARARGRAFLRFDYTGHGDSSGAFENGTIGDWAQDARDVLGALTQGPQILVGSSMGGWIALLIAREMPEKVAGLVGIAAAPDFTEDSMWAGFDDRQRTALMTTGRVELPSEYDDGPYVITRNLIENGRTRLVLRDPLPLPFPVRLLHGTADVDVAMSRPMAILEHAECDDLRLTYVKGADHRFSTPACLRLIERTVEEIA